MWRFLLWYNLLAVSSSVDSPTVGVKHYSFLLLFSCQDSRNSSLHMLLSRFGLCCSIHCAQENDLHSDLTLKFFSCFCHIQFIWYPRRGQHFFTKLATSCLHSILVLKAILRNLMRNTRAEIIILILFTHKKKTRRRCCSFTACFSCL